MQTGNMLGESLTIWWKRRCFEGLVKRGMPLTRSSGEKKVNTRRFVQLTTGLTPGKGAEGGGSIYLIG